MNINITKQQWTIIGVVVAIIAVWYFFLRKKKAESGFRSNCPEGTHLGPNGKCYPDGSGAPISESSWNPALGIKPVPAIPMPGDPVSPSNPPLVQCAPCKRIDSYCFPQALAKYKADLASTNPKVYQMAEWNFKGNLLRCLNCIN